MRKAVGIVLVFIGLLLFVISFPFAIQYSLFLAMVASLPASFIILFGCSLILGSGLKRAIEQCLLFVVAIMLPWIILLPFNYQVASLVLLATIFVSVFLWYRRKLLLQHEREKTGKDPTEASQA
jgi:hypothetical protein